MRDGKMLEEARRAGKLIEHEEELHYLRFREDFRKIPRGTVLLKDRIIYGFPHIPRIFTLERGLDRNMNVPFYIEEKIDGFNLRVAQVDGNMYAFSRGGFLDLFATEKVRGLKCGKFFSAHPDAVLCGEMTGNTPYTKPTDAFDVRLLVFDVDDGDGTYLPCEEKYKRLKKYDIASVPQLGRFSNARDAMRVAALLLKDKKEGMVIKSADRKKTVKFVTPYADIEDIRHNVRVLFDMPSGFFLQRVLRSAIFMRDFDLDRNGYGWQLGNAFYEGLLEGLKQVETEGITTEEFEISICNRKIWDQIVRHMDREVKIEKIFAREEGNRIRIRFRKIYKRSSKKLRDFLSGKPLID